MRKAILMVLGLFIWTSISAQSTHREETKVVFKGLGDYTMVQTTMVQADKSRTDTETEFKGNGLLNNAMAKMLLRSGSEGEIIDLPAMMVYDMNHKKRRYTERPIKPYEPETYDEDDMAGEEQQEEEYEEDSTEVDDPIEVVRTRFEVKDTGDQKDINNFPSRLYTILWLREWRNTDTNETGTDSLFTEVWTTPINEDIKTARDEERVFQQAYAEKLGMPAVEATEQLYGLNWIRMFNQMHPAEQSEEVSWGPEADELKKIQGYPVVVDGRYFALSPDRENGEQAEEQETEKSISGAKKLFGRIARKAVKKQVGPKVEAGDPDVQFYTELKEYGPNKIDPAMFSVPDHYKKD